MILEIFIKAALILAGKHVAASFLYTRSYFRASAEPYSYDGYRLELAGHRYMDPGGLGRRE